jgi:hypothetical protein
VTPEGHAEEVLALIKEWKKSAPWPAPGASCAADAFKAVLSLSFTCRRPHSFAKLHQS